MILSTGGGGSGWSEGCLARGCLLRGGAAPGGEGVPGREPPPGMATAAGGTHPTGMHSCSLFWFRSGLSLFSISQFHVLESNSSVLQV